MSTSNFKRLFGGSCWFIPGDIVWFEPNQKHWHGTTANNANLHIAIQENLDGKVADWLEKVTEEKYAQFKCY